MNSKLKLTLGILGFVILLGGSAWLYHSLSGSFTPDNELSADKTSQTQKVNTELPPRRQKYYLPLIFLSQIMTEMS